MYDAGTTGFARPPRTGAAVRASGDIEVPAPPPPPDATGPGMAAWLLPVGAAVAGVAVTVLLLTSGQTPAQTGHHPMYLVFPITMMLSAAAAFVHARSGGRAGELDARRDRYLDGLAILERDIAADLDRQRRALLDCHPPPQALWALVGGARMWERRPADPDYGHVRVGAGIVASVTELAAPACGAEPDPVTTTALQRVLDAGRAIAGAPITVDLTSARVVGIGGDPDRARASMRAVLCQLAVWHSPAELRVAAAVGAAHHDDWDWLKWLPHHHHPVDRDDAGPARLRYRRVAEAAAAAGRQTRWLVVVADDTPVPHGLPDGVTVLVIGDHPGASLTLPGTARPDLMSVPDALGCARRLARHRPVVETDSAGPSWPDLMRGAPGGSRTTPEADRLRVPIGATADGEPVHLDIKEPAAHGMGPHGLCVGATGSGKSELLRSIVLGMAARHSSEDLNLVLVDFKGGATFLGFDRLRHTAAVLTNLADEAYLVHRMGDALTGEISRRQQILRSAGNVAAIADYRRARSHRRLGPLPTLFIVVDEFSELLSAHPDFIDVFVAIARVGRSLGMHLLLATQRLDEGRIRGLDSHLSYRICLKTLSPNESRVAIGTSDAFHLPAGPGAGFLKVAAEEPIRFQAVPVSGPAPRAAPSPPHPRPAGHPRPFTAGPVGPVRAPGVATAAEEAATLLDTVVDELAGRGPAAHPVWLPPLGEAPGVETLGARLRPGALRVPIGVVDRVFEQRRTTLELDLAGGSGNVAVVGAPQSGKSTALRSLATALALGHGPAQVQLYCLDFGGGGLSALSELPHVGAVAARFDTDLVRRTVAEVAAVVRRREALFRQRGVASVTDYRLRREPGDDPFGDVFLVIDGWQALRQSFEAEEGAVTALAAEGLSYGVHVVLTAGRWADLRPALKDQIGTRIELRLTEPADSEIDRRQARLVPRRPGRGLSPDGKPMAIAVPPPVERVLAMTDWTGRAPRITTLPTRVDHDALPAVAPDRGVLIGLDENLVPVTLAFDGQAHLMICGDTGCGKTATLRVCCREITRTPSTARNRLVVVDPRRGLGGCVDPARGDRYVSTAAEVAEVVGPLAQTLRARVAGPWTGPDVYLVVDDHDILGDIPGDIPGSGLAGPGTNPLTPLLPLLPHSRDIGLHLIIARRCAAGRALYEPVLSAVRDAGAMTLQMSAAPDDGSIPGAARPRALPAGRGVLSTRTGEHLVQVGWVAAP